MREVVKCKRDAVDEEIERIRCSREILAFFRQEESQDDESHF